MEYQDDYLTPTDPNVLASGYGGNDGTTVSDSTNGDVHSSMDLTPSTSSVISRNDNLVKQSSPNTVNEVPIKKNKKACDRCRDKKTKCEMIGKSCTKCKDQQCLFTTEHRQPGNRKRNREILNDSKFKPSLEILKTHIELIKKSTIRTLVQPLTVKSILPIENSISFTDKIFENLANDMERKLEDVIKKHEVDILILSRVLVIISLNLLVTVNLIKLQKVKLPADINLEKSSGELEDFNFWCLDGCTTILSKYGMVQSKTVSEIQSNDDHPVLSNVDYNFALGALHLCMYFHSFDPNNKIERNGNVLRFGHRENNKLIRTYLDMSISNFSQLTDKNKYFSELFERIFTIERCILIISPFNYKKNDCCVTFKLQSKEVPNNNVDDHSKMLFRLFCILDEIDREMSGVNQNTFLNTLCHETSFTKYILLFEDNQIYNEIIGKINDKLNNEAETGPNPFEIIRHVLYIKLLLLYPMTFKNSVEELLSRLTTLIDHLNHFESNSLKISLSNYRLIPNLVHIMKIALYLKELMSTLNKEFHSNELVLQPNIDFNLETWMLKLNDGLNSNERILTQSFSLNLNQLISALNITFHSQESELSRDIELHVNMLISTLNQRLRSNESESTQNIESHLNNLRNTLTRVLPSNESTNSQNIESHLNNLRNGFLNKETFILVIKPLLNDLVSTLNGLELEPNIELHLNQLISTINISLHSESFQLISNVLLNLDQLKSTLHIALDSNNLISTSKALELLINTLSKSLANHFDLCNYIERLYSTDELLKARYSNNARKQRSSRNQEQQG
ncbi:hypothetical protein DFJ63DRAFT_311026 [Scheffersomyces coipomensis]|uniref:uncharacterized protein n=1 Tax=Scheffersomyces coipomensis TaxID=1788519 RepID=UPI00315D6B1E